MKLNKTVLQTALGIAVGSIAVSNAFAYNTGDVIEFQPGQYSCVFGGTYPNCTYYVNDVTGSYFAFDVDGNGLFDAVERTPIAPGPAGGIIIGVAQPAYGSHPGCTYGTETAGPDMPWCFFNNTGMHQTISIPVTDNGDGTLNFTGWGVTWNGIINIPLGGDPANFADDTGRAIISCIDAGCTESSIDYTAHVPMGDPSGFGGVNYSLHLESATATPSASISISVSGGPTQECSTVGGSNVSINSTVTVPDGDSVNSIIWSIDGTVVGNGELLDVFMALGSHVVNAEVITVSGLTATSVADVVIQDTTAPVVTAAFLSNIHRSTISHISRHGRFEVQAEATDICDPEPTIEAILGAATNDGNIISVSKHRGRISLEAESLELSVKASDASGNTASASATLVITE
ncbi:MAG TPA: hypothetical protein ENJ08_03180 [Gammaproteobacteria bacterium]|nr:hypothetical protein [Gammaproteobacteria bacterium]